MATVNFYLKRPKDTTTSAIFAVVCFGQSKPLKWYIGKSINPAYWSASKGRAKAHKDFPQSGLFNNMLDKIATQVQTIMLEYEIANQMRLPDHKGLKLLLDSKVLGKGPELSKMSFIDFCRDFVRRCETGKKKKKDGNRLSISTINQYKALYTLMLEYHKDNPFDFPDINQDWFDSLIDYFQVNDYKANSINQYVGLLRIFLNEALENEVTTNKAHKKFVVAKEDVYSIYMSEAEIEQFASIPCDTRHMKYSRDWFVICCYAGQRFSDMYKLNFDDPNYFYVQQQKTGAKVAIPIQPVARRIIEKYGGKMPKEIHYVTYMEHIRQIAAKCPLLANEVTINYTEGKDKKVDTVPRYALIGTHTARRSFATNAYLAGVPVPTIMAVTGHKSEAMLFKYIRITPNEHAKIMAEVWRVG